jgi:nucleoside triphosphate diphosphatase
MPANSREQQDLHDSDGPENADGPPRHAAHSAPADALLGRALALVRFLRTHCPWDARQDPRSLRPYLLEEAHEVADAILAADDGALAAELGDLLLNLAFQIVLGEERGAFDAGTVVERMETKMRDRHPHIYGDAETPADWEALKARERGEDPFEGVAAGLEPLSRALRVQERMAALGFDWDDAWGPLAKVREEADETAARLAAWAATTGSEGASAPHPEPVRGTEARDALAEEIGDLLFAVVNLARMVDVHPSDALIRATSKFEARSREIRRLAAERKLDWEEATLEELDVLWEEIKQSTRGEEGKKATEGKKETEATKVTEARDAEQTEP